MTTLLANRGIQPIMAAEFRFTAADAMVDVNGNLVGFKAASGVFEPIKLPPNAVVVGGDLTVEVVSNDSGTATLTVGDKTTANRYLAATNLKAAARTALVPTGYRGVGEDIRITLANQNGDATAGTYTLRVHYIVSGRATEVQAN